METLEAFLCSELRRAMDRRFGFAGKRRFLLAKQAFGNSFVSYPHGLGNSWALEWGIVLEKELLAEKFFENRRREWLDAQGWIE